MKSKKNDMLDLQLFAQASDQLQNTTATLTAEMKTYYEKRLLDQAEPALVHNQFGDPYPIPANGGKTIELRRYDSLPKATTPLTEGVTPNGQTLKVSTVTAELHQYGGWVPITDVLKTTALDNNVLQATKILASQAGRTLDSVTRDVLVGGTNVLYASKTVDGVETAVNSRKNLDKTAKITLEICLRASAQLKAMNTAFTRISRTRAAESMANSRTTRRAMTGYMRHGITCSGRRPIIRETTRANMQTRSTGYRAS